MKMCGRVGVYFCECLNCALEREVSGQLHASSSLPPNNKRYKFNYILEGEENRVTYKVLVGKSEGKSPLGKPRSGKENNINWVFKKCDGKRGLNLSD
jgi:hypothetical protein